MSQNPGHATEQDHPGCAPRARGVHGGFGDGLSNLVLVQQGDGGDRMHQSPDGAGESRLACADRAAQPYDAHRRPIVESAPGFGPDNRGRGAVGADQTRTGATHEWIGWCVDGPMPGRSSALYDPPGKAT